MSVAVREQQIHVVSETTYGTDPVTPPPTTWLDVLEPMIEPQHELLEDERVRAVHSGNPHQMIPSHNNVAFGGYLSGKSGLAGTGPDIAAILKACNLAETLVASTSAAYKPVTVSDDMALVPSLTVYQYLKESNGQARLQKCHGVRGNMTLTLEQGRRAAWRFEGRGLFQELGALAAAPALPTAYSGAKVPFLCVGIVCTIGGTAYPLRKIELSTGWTLEERRDWAGTALLKQLYLKRGSGARIGGSLEFLNAAILDHVLTNYGASALMALSITLTNGTDTLVISAPALQLGQWARQAGNLHAFSVPFFLNGDFASAGGDNDFQLLYT